MGAHYTASLRLAHHLGRLLVLALLLSGALSITFKLTSAIASESSYHFFIHVLWLFNAERLVSLLTPYLLLFEFKFLLSGLQHALLDLDVYRSRGYSSHFIRRLGHRVHSVVALVSRVSTESNQVQVVELSLLHVFRRKSVCFIGRW